MEIHANQTSPVYDADSFHYKKAFTIQLPLNKINLEIASIEGAGVSVNSSLRKSDLSSPGLDGSCASATEICRCSGWCPNG